MSDNDFPYMMVNKDTGEVVKWHTPSAPETIKTDPEVLERLSVVEGYLSDLIYFIEDQFADELNGVSFNHYVRDKRNDNDEMKKIQQAINYLVQRDYHITGPKL